MITPRTDNSDIMITIMIFLTKLSLLYTMKLLKMCILNHYVHLYTAKFPWKNRRVPSYFVT